MAFVVTESCIKCKYTDCVDVCPVDCFREGRNMLVINPDECIDCAVCVPECPVNAIYAEADVPLSQQAMIALNAELASIWLAITQRINAPAMPTIGATTIRSSPLLERDAFNLRTANEMAAFTEEQVLSVQHWTDRLFSFITTRDRSLRFRNGHFTMIGMNINDQPVLRAYSIASPNYEEHLEFLSIKVANGPLTSRLQHVKPGDSVLIGHKSTGTLVLDYLLPGSRLFLLATGTGLAPFLSIVRDPETYEKFGKVILVHGVRTIDELAYRQLLD